MGLFSRKEKGLESLIKAIDNFDDKTLTKIFLENDEFDEMKFCLLQRLSLHLKISTL